MRQHTGDILSSSHQTTIAFTAAVATWNATQSLQDENYSIITIKQMETSRENEAVRWREGMLRHEEINAFLSCLKCVCVWGGVVIPQRR